ncbi:MAG: polyprenyl synthetase family protein [Terracidiphilus sp.]
MPTVEILQAKSAHPFLQALRDALPLPQNLDASLRRALRHVVENPGSMVRPQLAMQTAAAYGMDEARARDLAVALEYFHTASLIFDDLPCMDDAQQRRGVACVHRAHGQAEAILAALALINRAYALTWRSMAGAAAPVQARAMVFIEQCLGVEGLLNGQSLDLHYETLPHTVATTERIARGKTVSLIRLTLVLPAMLAGAAESDLQLLERISTFWGLGYQMVDDLKDILQDARESGKTPSRDALLGRPNVAAVLGIRPAVRRLTRMIDLGDRVLERLVARRPALGFLARLRGELQLELARVTRNSNALDEALAS